MRGETVSHEGKVVSADAQFVTVQIISESACSACHANSLCSMSEQTTKEIQVPTPVSEFYAPGDEVYVDLKASMGHKAVWIAYALPLLVMMGVIFAFLSAGAGELCSGIAGIAATAIYYLCIWLMRGRLQDQYIFSIRKK